MTVVMFERRGYDYAVRFTYSPVLVNVIKSTVPGYARSWDQPSKRWTIEADWATVLAAEIRRLGYEVVGLDPPELHRDRDDVSQWARTLFKRVGRHHSDRVYRALSKCLHPDVGGDTELQRELNTAFSELAEARRKTA